MTTYKFKLHAKAKREGYLDDKITRHLMLYNRIVELGDRFYKKYKRILRSRALTKYVQMKKKDPSWNYILEGLNAWAVQETIKRRDEGLDRFFKYLKKKKKNPKVKPKESPPQKHRIYGEGSYKLHRGNGWKLIDGGVATGYMWNMFGKKKDIHTYKFFGNRKIEGAIRNAVVKRDAYGDFWWCITTTHTVSKPLPKTGRMGGFDYSQEHFFVSDDGRFWDIPLALEDSLQELNTLNHKMHKAQVGSNNRRRWKAKRARLYRHIENKRREAHYALAYRMCREYDVMCFEGNDYLDLYDKKREVNGHRVSKKQRIRMKSLAPASFLVILKEVAKKTGKTVFVASQHFASSQICSECGYKNAALKELRVRKWECPKCGATHDRDINAARNLVKEFERTAGGASSVEAQTGAETERGSYWSRIRKSASVKRAAGAGEKSPCPRGHGAAHAEKASVAVAVCQELYTDAYTVDKEKEGEKPPRSEKEGSGSRVREASRARSRSSGP